MTRFLAPALVLACLAAPSAAAESGFSGDWATTYGDMTLAESSSAVTGTYIMEGSVCSLEGKRANGTLTFTCREPEAAGEGRFRLSPDGKSFEGEWRAKGTARFIPWLGRRRLPPEAGAELERLMPFTARKNSKTPYDGVSFRLLPAPGAAL